MTPGGLWRGAALSAERDLSFVCSQQETRQSEYNRSPFMNIQINA